jgi:DNA repair protein RecN (Recombination protein N)
VLSLLKVKNIALIDELSVEFGRGLNLLTGETGSGKSIIVDSLGALTGERISNDLIKQGTDHARIEGLFTVDSSEQLIATLDQSGIEYDDAGSIELIVRRELSLTGKNRIFINGQLVTLSLLRQIGDHLADIHGQGEQAALYNVSSHVSMLDGSAGVQKEKAAVANAFTEWEGVRGQLASLSADEAEKLQLLDVLRFQIKEIADAGLDAGEDDKLEDEKRRLNNVEKLSLLTGEAYNLLYDDEHSTKATLDKASRIIAELAEFDERFRGFDEQIESAKAVVDDLGSTARDFAASLEFSPQRLDEIEDRLAELGRLKRKYGGSLEDVIAHLAASESRLESIETAELRVEELKKELADREAAYRKAAASLSAARKKASAVFAKRVEDDLRSVAFEKARFEVRIEPSSEFSANGGDRVEFYFSANPGEEPRPLAKVASGGEASRLMLVLKTASRTNDHGKTSVFDEIDVGIGGRVAEAVGRRLKGLAAETQVFCVTHQPQIASLADHHFVVEKETRGGKTSVRVRELSPDEKVEELARMLAGEQITDAARENARAMLASAK